jgi:S1-C subfamily serine protease
MMKKVTSAHKRQIVAVIFLITALIGCAVWLQPNLGQNKIQYNVVIEATYSTPFGERYRVGSGVVISDTGRILTAAHVIDGAKSVRVTLHNGKVFDIDSFYVDVERDVGIIDLGLPFGSVDFMPLSDSDDVEKGHATIHVGNANGIWTDTVIRGKIYDPAFYKLSLGKDIEFIVVKMEIKPGCSGGGVYIGDELIGIVSVYWDGAAIIIPSNVCRLVLEEYDAQ